MIQYFFSQGITMGRNFFKFPTSFIYKFGLLTVLAASFWQTSYCQKFKDVIGPSPAAAAFAKYGNIPVNNYTGIPNINIPLDTIQNKEIKVPITLSYHAGGFTVDEEAGRAGLGWTLDAGGVISRNVNGEDDFLIERGYLNNTMPEFFDVQATNFFQSHFSSYLVAQDEQNTYTVVGISTNLTPYAPNPVNTETSSFDMEPDIYNYNVNGISGKFTIKKNKEIVKQSPDGVVIKLLNNDGTSWQIITTDGVKYTFAKTEKCRFQSTAGAFKEYITSWYLTEIMSPTGNVVNLTYTDNQSYSVRSLNNLNERYIMEVSPADGYSANYGLKPNPGERNNAYPAIKTYPLILLSSISFPHGSVTFEYANRIDLFGDKRLSRILINNTSHANSSFSFELVQDYFTATVTSGAITDPELNMDQNLFNKRLKLLSLVKKNYAGVIEQTYQFNYNPLELPTKKSFARDHWGFYNGATNTTFLPNTKFLSDQLAGQTVSYSNGANRNPSPVYCKASMLKEIIYPTGGTTQFEFEINDYDVANSVHPSSVLPPPQILTERKEFSTRRNMDETFNITFLPRVPGSKIGFNINSQNGETVSWPQPQSTDAFIEIYAANNLVTPVVRTLLGLESFWVNENTLDHKYHRDDQFDLPPGDYVIKTHIADNVRFLNYIQFSFQYNYYYDEQTTHRIEIGGGLRVAKLTNVDPVNNQSHVQRFNYHYNFDYDEDGIAEDCSYGRRMTPIRYAYHEYVKRCGMVEDPIEGFVYRQGVSITHNLFSQSGIVNNQALVGYDKVSVFNGSDASQGYSLFEYKNLPGLEISYSANVSFWGGVTKVIDLRPSGLPNMSVLSNGLLEKQTDYKYTGPNQPFLKVRELINNYMPSTTITQTGLSQIVVFESNCAIQTANSWWMLAQYPAFQSSWQRLASRTTNDYIDATNFVLTLEEYEYESGTPRHYQPIITTLNNSFAKKKVTVSLYPTDYADGNVFLDDMKSANIITPIEQVSYLKEGSTVKILSGTISTYKTGGKGLLDIQYGLEARNPILLSAFKFSNRTLGSLPSLSTGGLFSIDGAYKPKISFNKYDGQGNLLSVTPTDAPTINYIYSYQGQYPVAEIKNADYTTIETALGGSGVIDTYRTNTFPSDGTIQSLAASLRSNLSLKEAFVTAYTYRPLVGMTSIIDAKGKLTTFEYDAFQRLRFIKDQDGKATKAYDYHYQGQ